MRLNFQNFPKTFSQEELTIFSHFSLLNICPRSGMSFEVKRALFWFVLTPHNAFRSRGLRPRLTMVRMRGLRPAERGLTSSRFIGRVLNELEN